MKLKRNKCQNNDTIQGMNKNNKKEESDVTLIRVIKMWDPNAKLNKKYFTTEITRLSTKSRQIIGKTENVARFKKIWL